MKKTFSLLLSLSLVSFSLIGCTPQGNAPVAEKPAEQTPSQTPSETPVAEGSLKTGLAVISKTAKSKDAGDSDGLAQVDSTVVAVTVDAEGKIQECLIDVAQTKINFSATGEITTDKNGEFRTKQQLGPDYGMLKASPIGKEWYEQADALSAYVVGKTMDEVKGIAVNEKGAPADSELAASVTVTIVDYIAAIEKAVVNAQDAGAKVGDKLGLGVVTNIAKSKDAADADGVAQAYSTYTATTFDVDGKITSCLIDSSQTNVNFSKEGKITSDINASYKTKQELGPDYGMLKASPIGKEWYEQANALSEYVVGKTVEEVSGISLNEKQAPTDSELAASVTVSIGDYIAVIEKAGLAAK